jgi:hypothetical protein
MFSTLYMLTLLGQTNLPPDMLPAPGPLDRADVVRTGDIGQFNWADAEDRVTGSYSPYEPNNQDPVDVVVRVGAMHGDAFTGPVTLTLKGKDVPGAGDTKTVTMSEGSKAWSAQLRATEAGPHYLEIGWATTRRKQLRVELTIVDAPLPRWPWYVFTGLIGAIAIGFGVRAVMGRKT